MTESALFPASSPLTIVMFGAGNVAVHLAPALTQAGHRIVGVWSRDSTRATALAAQLPGAAVLSNPAAAVALQPDLIVVAVPDYAVGELVRTAQLPPAMAVAHTAGALPLPAHPRAGVFYPLQTFSAARPLDWSVVPFFLEATDIATAAILTRLAADLSQRPAVWLTTAERAPLHLAAVFAANFTNHLLGVSQRIVARLVPKVGFDVLRPLVEEVIAKSFAAPQGPFSVQTGPAHRADAPTLTAHRAQLTADAALASWEEVYTILSASIARVAAEQGRAGSA